MLKLSVVIVCAIVSLAYTAPASDINQKVTIESYANKPLNNENKYSFHYVLSDGQAREENAKYVTNENGDTHVELRGSYEFVGTDGETYQVRYTVDDHGFQPEGKHLPGYKGPAAWDPPITFAALLGR